MPHLHPQAVLRNTAWVQVVGPVSPYPVLFIHNAREKDTRLKV
jgi:hypothetical protein